MVKTIRSTSRIKSKTSGGYGEEITKTTVVATAVFRLRTFRDYLLWWEEIGLEFRTRSISGYGIHDAISGSLSQSPHLWHHGHREYHTKGAYFDEKACAGMLVLKIFQ